jgi:hypothetical protein
MVQWRILRHARWAVAVLAVGVVTAALPGGAVAERDAGTEPAAAALVEVFVADRAALDRLIDSGADLAEKFIETDAGITVYAVVTPDEAQALREQGFLIGRTLETEANWAAAVAEREAKIQAKRRGQTYETLAVSPTGAVKLLRADYFHELAGAVPFR